MSNLTELSIVDYEIKMSIDLKGIFDDFTKVEDEEVFYLSSADDGYLYKVFLNNGVNISKIYLGGMPSTLKWAGRTQLYITNILKGEINILDTLSNQIVKNLRVGKEPCGILLL